jgi:hypothetical protein
MDIKVIDNNIGLGDKSIQVVINDVKFSCDAIGKPYIMFWIDEEKASSLAWHLNTVIEDRERTKKTLAK